MTVDTPLTERHDVTLLADARRMAGSGEARALRLAAGLTLEEIAGAVGVTRQAVAAWETGERRPRGENARRYGEALRGLRATADRVRGAVA